jgi:hypothetical protein
MECQLAGVTMGEGLAWASFWLACVAAYFVKRHFDLQEQKAKKK